MTLIVIALLVLLIIGGQRLATLGKGLGEGAKAFKKAVRVPEEPQAERPSRPVIIVSAEPLPDDAPRTPHESSKPDADPEKDPESAPR